MKIRLLLFICILTVLFVNAQRLNWQNMDLKKDSMFGISTERAYSELLMNKKPVTVTVAIIDSGIDTMHEDLQSVLWTDKKTGIHGWNFIGPETGREDVTNLVATKKEFYDSLCYTLVPEVYRAGYLQYRKVVPALSGKIAAMLQLIEELQEINTGEARQMIQLAQYHLEHGLNIGNTEADTATGNSDVTSDKIAPLRNPNLTPLHGTHVAGIIGALRNNGKGLDGIADRVALMILKINGNIRELRDKSLAKAIRYAVDHGARVINLSFGKPYTWNKKLVDEAVNYAAMKDVLLVHAAGNNGEDVDKTDNFPNPVNKTTWIEVGASGPKDDATLAASFSNYGKKSVDVFAPGIDIYSTIPENKYSVQSGTSMATPVVAGLAALIREYYPKLSAQKIKEIILKTVLKRDVLKDKCKTGGVINAYNALKLAAKYK